MHGTGEKELCKVQRLTKPGNNIPLNSLIFSQIVLCFSKRNRRTVAVFGLIGGLFFHLLGPFLLKIVSLVLPGLTSFFFMFPFKHCEPDLQKGFLTTLQVNTFKNPVYHIHS